MVSHLKKHSCYTLQLSHTVYSKEPPDITYFPDPLTLSHYVKRSLSLFACRIFQYAHTFSHQPPRNTTHAASETLHMLLRQLYTECGANAYFRFLHINLALMILLNYSFRQRQAKSPSSRLCGKARFKHRREM